MAALAEGPYDATSERMELDVDGEPVDAIHARPSGTPLGGVVLFPDLGGLRPLFDDLCRRLATHGLAVCAIEHFVHVPRDERETMTVEERMARVPELYDDRLMRNAAEAADHLEAVDGLSGSSVMGFCMGGYYTLKAAATARFERAVSFYGMVRTPERWEGPGHASPIDRVAEVCPTLMIVGDVDPWVPVADIDALRAGWSERPDCKVVVYRGADHGFVHDPERAAHRAEDAADAWRRALSWLFEGE